MSIEQVGVKSNSFFTKLLDGGKVALNFCGRVLSSGYHDYLVPAVKATWKVSLTGLQAIFAFLRTGFGMGSLCISLGCIFLAIANKVSLHGKVASYILQALAVVCFIGGGAAMVFGTAVLL